MATITAPPLDQIAPRNSQDPDDTSLNSAHHRRIELQSPADLTYLMNNVARAARAKIDLHLPLEAALREGEMGVDEMRRTVEMEVQKWVDGVFEGAKGGININGVEAEHIEWEREVPEEYEPYDTRLAARISALHANIEQLNLTLANTRRTAAARAASDFQKKFIAQSEEVGKRMTQMQEETMARGTEDQGLSGLKLGFEGREEEVARTWERAIVGLREVNGSLRKTTNEAERAAQVVAALGGR